MTRALALSLALLATLVTAGCPNNVACKPNTAFISITFDAASAAADGATVTVTVAGAAPHDYPVAKPAGSNQVTLELDFSHGYVAGQQLDVKVVATRSGTPIGSGENTASLASGCSTLTVPVTGSGGDMLGAPGDMTTCDCEVPPPAGWVFARLLEQSSGSLPACPSGYTAMGGTFGTGATDTGCGACTCGAVTSPSCGLCVQRWTSTLCMGTSFANDCNLNGQQCYFWASAGQPAEGVTAYAVGKGSCTASANLNPPAFATNTEICLFAGTGATCGSANECVPPNAAPFFSTACIAHASPGDATCPSSYPNKHSYATGFTDGRSSTGCSCGSAAGIQCTGGTIADCNNPNSSPLGACHSFTPDATRGLSMQISVLPTVNASNAVCAPAGTASSSGMITPTGTQVVCCQ